MSFIPGKFDLADMQTAFRKVWAVIGFLPVSVEQNIDLHGRRIINAGRAVAGSDYVTHDELGEVPGEGGGEGRNVFPSFSAAGTPGVVAKFVDAISLGDSVITELLGKIGIGTGAPVAKLAINGGLHVGGDSDPGDNNALIDGTLEVDGDATFVGGGSGLPYGGCYGSEIAVVQTINTTYLLTDAGIASLPLNLVTHAAGVLTVTRAGTYLINASISLACGVANDHIKMAIRSDAGGGTTLPGDTHDEFSALGVEHTMALSTIATLAAGVALQIYLTTTVSTDVLLNHVTFTAVMIGG